MAKLNGVQTIIPAQAERIQYDGVEYVKSDKDAVAGDIIRFEEDGYTTLRAGRITRSLGLMTRATPKSLTTKVTSSIRGAMTSSYSSGWRPQQIL